MNNIVRVKGARFREGEVIRFSTQVMSSTQVLDIILQVLDITSNRPIIFCALPR